MEKKKKDFSVLEFNKQAEEDLFINTETLQEGWEKQAVLFMQYAMGLSLLIKKKDKYRAQLSDSIVTDPTKYGIEGKLSEAALNRLVDGDEEYINLCFQLNCYSNAVKAFEHKKKALEWESQLLQGGFFSEPSTKKLNKK